MRIVRILLLVLLALAPLAAQADGQFKIAATVGDEIITTYDLANRAKLIIYSSGLPGDKDTFNKILPQALQSLINDKIILQEAARLGTEISAEEIANAQKSIETKNKMPDGQLAKMLAETGIPPKTLTDQIKSQIALSKIKSSKVRPFVTVSEEEVEDFVRAQSFNQEVEEYFINEIVLPIEAPEDEKKTAELAAKLYTELKSGKDFGAIARQFSGSASAYNDGIVGWLPETQVPKEIMAEIKKNDVGVVSRPIRSVEGLYIVKVSEKRKRNSIAQEDEINLKSFELKYPAKTKDAKATEAKMRDVVQKLAKLEYTDDACNNPAAFAMQNGLGSKDFGNLAISDLEPKIRPLVSDLEVGKFSPPAKTQNSALVFLVCERIENIAPLIDDNKRDMARGALFERKMDLQGRKYMRDLRRKTNIEIKL